MSHPAVITSIFPFPGTVPGFIDAFIKQGLNIQDWFDYADIDINIISMSDVYLSTEQMNKFLEIAYPHLSAIDPAAGLHMAQMMQPVHFGILGQLMTASSTVGKALMAFIKYKDLVAPFSDLTLEFIEDKAILGVKIDSPADFPFNFLHNEVMIGALVFIGRIITENALRIDTVKFSHKQPLYIEEYEIFFRTSVIFEHDRNEIIVKKSILDVKIPFANEKFYLDNIKIADKKLKDFSERYSITYGIKKFIENNLSNQDLSIKLAAKNFNMSVRTLQRKLDEEKTSFIELRDGVRQEMAIKYLRDSYFKNLTMDEIARKLGFSHTTGFYAYFKRLYGKPPMEYRQYNPSANTE